MPGVTTAYQTGIHSARPAASSGCILYSCTTHGLVYRSDGTTWTTFLTLPSGSSAGTPALTFGTAAAAGSSGTFINTDATLPIFDATVPTTQAFSDAAAAGSAGVAARRDHKHGMPASPGGGGLAQSYVGYNAVGGTWTAMSAARQYVKKITLASAANIMSVEAHLRANTDNFADYEVMLLSDNAGVPDLLLAVAGGYSIILSNATTGLPHTGRWFAVPLHYHLAAGDYWIGVRAGATYYDIANDGSGSDVFWTDTGAYVSGSHSALAKTTGSVKYSIRASILS